jgi:hypothetical protein
MWAVPQVCGCYPGICLTTEEKAWKNLSQGSRRVIRSFCNNTERGSNFPHITLRILKLLMNKTVVGLNIFRSLLHATYR